MIMKLFDGKTKENLIKKIRKSGYEGFIVSFSAAKAHQAFCLLYMAAQSISY